MPTLVNTRGNVPLELATYSRPAPGTKERYKLAAALKLRGNRKRLLKLQGRGSQSQFARTLRAEKSSLSSQARRILKSTKPRSTPHKGRIKNLAYKTAWK